MIISQTKIFGKQKKKLHSKQIKSLDQAVKKIATNPTVGILKKGDLQGIRIYKFKITNQEYLLAYTESREQIILLALGTHENFYRDLKKIL